MVESFHVKIWKSGYSHWVSWIRDGLLLEIVTLIAPIRSEIGKGTDWFLGDFVRWPDENGVERIVVAHGMIGTVVTVSDGRLRQEVREELGLPPRDVSRAVVEFDNGVVAAVDVEIKSERCTPSQLSVEIPRESVPFLSRSATLEPSRSYRGRSD